MSGVIDLAAWRRDHCSGQDRLDRAIGRLEGVFAEGHWDSPPQWLVTELLAIQGCLSVGLLEEAAWRADRLTIRAGRAVHRRGRIGTR